MDRWVPFVDGKTSRLHPDLSTFRRDHSRGSGGRGVPLTYFLQTLWSSGCASIVKGPLVSLNVHTDGSGVADTSPPAPSLPSSLPSLRPYTSRGGVGGRTYSPLVSSLETQVPGHTPGLPKQESESSPVGHL